jgi:hypothetical protein
LLKERVESKPVPGAVYPAIINNMNRDPMGEGVGVLCCKSMITVGGPGAFSMQAFVDSLKSGFDFDRYGVSKEVSERLE